MEAISPAASPLSYADQARLRDRVLAALDTLPASQRQAVALHQLLEYSLKETSSLMAKTPSSVASLIHRGLRNMARTLGSRA